MKLKYKILWIEDEKISIKIKARNIRRYLEDEYGFECLESDITILDYEEFNQNYILNNQIKIDSDIDKFDLLLVDFNLGEEEHTGDKLIQIIRDSNIYSEILFYSSDLDSLLERLNKHFIDGVFTSVRDELEDKIKKLIKVTIKKVQDVNNLRGLIMAEVSELDRIKEQIIIKYANKNKCGTLEKYILKTLEKSYNDKTKDVIKYTDSPIDEIIDKLYIDSDKKARTIKKVDNSFSEIEYRKNILKIRNKFAHLEEKDNMVGDIEFTEKNCIKIRKDIKRYKGLLKNIEKSINE